MDSKILSEKDESNCDALQWLLHPHGTSANCSYVPVCVQLIGIEGYVEWKKGAPACRLGVD